MLSTPATIRVSALVSALVIALSATPGAQWSSDAGTNLLLSDGDGEEVQAKIAALEGGGALVSWYDSDPDGTPAFGYDVRLQRLDAAGREQWAPGGVVIADRGFSSTQDYGLSSADGDGYLAFRDDRLVGTQVTATRVDSDGVQVWGPLGVQVTNTTEFVATPRIAATSDGESVVGWTQGSTSVLQRLSSSGQPLWGAGVKIPTPGGAVANISDVIAAEDGAVIVSWIFQSGPAFFLPRHLRAQKLSAAGAPMWGTGVVLFDTGSLQIGNFPPLVPDGSGGAIAAWYGVSPLQCYAQHVLADGTFAFGASPVEVSIAASTIRTNPSAAHDPQTGETFVFWVEQTPSQGQHGIFGQKLDAAGARLWTDSGLAFVPVGSSNMSHVRTVLVEGGAAAVWFQADSGFATDEVRGLRVDGAGALVHAIATLASTPSSKDDLVATTGPFDELRVAWHGDENGDYDVLAQDLRADGGLGPAAGTLVRNAGGNVESYTGTIGPLGGTLELDVDLTTTGHAFALVAGYLAPAELPFGTDVLLVDIFNPWGEVLGLGLGMGPKAHWSATVPANPNLSGIVLATQAVHADFALPLQLANALDIYIGL